jgi:hypothetical protein
MTNTPEIALSPAGRLRTAPRLLTAGFAAVLSLGLLIAAAPASSAATGATRATGEGYELTSGTASFTAAGHAWQLSLSASGGKLGAVVGANDLTFLITTKYLGGTEVHSWVAKSLPAKDLSVTGSGHAAFKTGGTLAPVATFSLAFTPTSHAKASCASGSETDYTGKLAGTVSLTTGLKGVKVSKHFTFGKPDTLTVTRGCVPPAACDFSGWVAGNPTGILAAGVTVGQPGHQATDTTVERASSKTASKHLVRAGGGYMAVPAPKFNSKAKSLAVAGSPAGIVTGRGLLANGKMPSKPTPFTCFIGKQKYTETEAYYLASFSSSKTFEARTLLTGTITAPSSGTGFFTIDKLKKS